MSSSFVLLCPKCSSTGLERFHDRTFFGNREDITLKCRTCGKVIYGTQAVEAEWKKQKRAWAADAPERLKRQVAAEADHREKTTLQRRAIEATRAAHEAARRKVAEADQAREQEHLRWTEKTNREHQVQWVPETIDPACAWERCDSLARDGSIYCSRNCSNRNARHRHKQRQREERHARS